jgi:hypothetical protein
MIINFSLLTKEQKNAKLNAFDEANDENKYGFAKFVREKHIDYYRRESPEKLVNLQKAQARYYESLLR